MFSVEIVPAFHITPPQLIALLMRNTCALAVALTLALSGPHWPSHWPSQSVNTSGTSVSRGLGSATYVDGNS